MALAQNKHYTAEDYYNIPEEIRAELINGEIVYMSTPNRIHQEILKIVSPSNPAHDYIDKLNLYTRASVREYWIVDPQNQNIHVYNLEPDKFSVKIFTFHDTVKAGIYEDLFIDFAALDLDGLNENE